MRKLIILIVAGISLLVLATPVRASQWVALVIGNAKYAHAPALANPLTTRATASRWTRETS